MVCTSVRPAIARLATVLLAALSAAPAARAQNPAPPPMIDVQSLYTKQEVRIPMRDGVHLFTAIYIPRDTTRLHPIVMTRTPYSVGPYGADHRRYADVGQVAAYVHAGYILVYQDVRGRWMSEGTYMDVRPYIEHKHSNQDVDETSDTYDTVEWLVHNVAGNNGRVGVRGTSYPGFYASMAAIDAHPAIKVVSPQAPVTEWMGGDDFMHNGALLLPHAFDFYWGFGWPRPRPTTHDFHPVDFGTPDGYAFFLKLGPLANANLRFFHDSVAFWDSIAAHPTWDAFWAARSARPHLKNLRPAMLWVGGWFDTENLWGALHAYAAAEAQSPGAVNRLVMGPWSHGQWNGGTADSLGAVGWGSMTAQFYTDSIEVPFFNYYLLDSMPAPRTYEAAVFNTGANIWRFLDAWPPRNARERNLYLQADGGLAFAPPAQHGRVFDEYVSDPAKPVPYTDAITHWYQGGFMVEDQRFASRRPDVLVYQTPVLDSAVTVAGPVDVAFSVSTSGTDCDWIVKVIDVFPDTGAGSNPRAPNTMAGYEMLVRGDVLRGKFRNSMSRPQPFVPNAVTPIHYRMNDIFHTFRPGHRIMVQVQSTWFPMIDRNPGRFMDIWHATDADFHKTTQRVFRSAEYPSHVVLPVVDGAR
jgi:putative CocE/NonD family hydrolase